MVEYTLFGQKINFDSAMVKYFDLKYLIGEKVKEAQRSFFEWYQECGSFEAVAKTYIEQATKLVGKLALKSAYDSVASLEDTLPYRTYLEASFSQSEKMGFALLSGCRTTLAEIQRLSPQEKNNMYSLPQFRNLLFAPIEKDFWTAYALHMHLLNRAFNEINYPNLYTAPSEEESMAIFQKATKSHNEKEKLLIQALELWPLNEKLVGYIYVNYPQERSTIINIMHSFHEEISMDDE